MTARRGGLPLWEAEHGRQKGKCRECGEPVPKGRRSWCSQECVDAHRLRTDPNFQRLLVFNRDRGICRKCKRDCVALRKELRPLTSWGNNAVTLMALVKKLGGLPGWWRRDHGEERADKIEHAIRVADELGLLQHVGSRESLWDLDHVVPLWDGGTHDLSNLRTLCIPHHREKTKTGAARRAAMKRGETT